MENEINSILSQMDLPPEMQDALREQIAFLMNGFFIISGLLPILLLLIFFVFYNLQKKKRASDSTYNPVVAKKYWISLSLCTIFGFAGFHRFYLGRWLSGILMLLTMGAFGIWQLIDLYLIIAGRFKDSDGALVQKP